MLAFLLAAAALGPLSAQPDKAHALFHSGYYKETATRDLTGAIEDYRAALSLFEKLPAQASMRAEVRLRLARTLFAAGDRAAAEREVATCLERDPENAEALALRARMTGGTRDDELQRRIAVLIEALDGERAASAEEELYVLWPRSRGALVGALRSRSLNVVKKAAGILIQNESFEDILRALKSDQVTYKGSIIGSLSRLRVCEESIPFLRALLALPDEKIAFEVRDLLQKQKGSRSVRDMPQEVREELVHVLLKSRRPPVSVVAYELAERTSPELALRCFEWGLECGTLQDSMRFRHAELSQRWPEVWAVLAPRWHEAMVEHLSQVQDPNQLRFSLREMGKARPGPSEEDGPAIKAALLGLANTPGGIDALPVADLTRGAEWTLEELVSLFQVGWGNQQLRDLLLAAIRERGEDGALVGLRGAQSDQSAINWFQLLNRAGIFSVDAAFEAAEHPERNIRLAGYVHLNESGRDFAGREGLPFLLRDREGLRSRTFFALCRAWKNPALVEGMRPLLRPQPPLSDGESATARNTIEALSETPGDAVTQEMRATLRYALKEDRKGELILAARNAVLAREGGAAVPFILESARDATPVIRQVLLRDWSGDDATWSRLFAGLPDEHPRPHWFFRSPQWPLIPAERQRKLLDQALTSRTALQRREAIKVLRELDREEAAPLLVPLIQDPDDGVAKAAREVLEGWKLADEVARLGDRRTQEDARKKALSLLKAKDPDLRVAAIWALVALRSPEAVAPLLDATSDPAPKVRAAATAGLEKLAGQD